MIARWKQRALKDFRLYAVTDIQEKSSGVLTAIEQALSGGVDIIQLRSKTLMDAELIALGKRIRVLTNRMRKLFIVNDRPDIAYIVQADGVHVGQDDMPIAQVRTISKRLSYPLIVGVSTHGISQARDAERQGADYIGVGPIFATPTKETYTPVGLKLITQVAKEIEIPFVCIGGINEKNIGEVVAHGGTRVAVVRAIFGARSVRKAAQHLRGLLP